jgi:tetratricopeptide repeat protein 30
LDTDTWYYAKRCFLALAENLAKNMTVLRDGTQKEIITFLDQCDKFGKDIPTVIVHFSPEDVMIEHPTVAHEARQLKSIFLKLRDW